MCIRDRQVLGWFIAAIFFFPIYFWITVSIKKDKDIFALPPKLFDFEVSFAAYEEVFGISRFLYVEDMGAVRPGGGDFYMMPNLVDSIIIALGSTGIAMLISLSLIHISEPTRPLYNSYAVFCLKKKSFSSKEWSTKEISQCI